MNEKKYNKVLPILSGVIFALIICIIVYYLPLNYGQDFFALLLASLSAVYLISAFREKQIKSILTEVFLFLFIFFIVFFGLYYFSFVLGIGYILHALWSFFHSPHRLGANVGNDIPRFFMAFNFIIALYIFIYSL